MQATLFVHHRDYPGLCRNYEELLRAIASLGECLKNHANAKARRDGKRPPGNPLEASAAVEAAELAVRHELDHLTSVMKTCAMEMLRTSTDLRGDLGHIRQSTLNAMTAGVGQAVRHARSLQEQARAQLPTGRQGYSSVAALAESSVGLLNEVLHSDS